MKTSLIIFLLSLFFQLNANELHWVDEQIKAIKPSRIGLKSTDLVKLKDPFIFVKSKDTAKKKSKKAKHLYRSTYHKKRTSLKKLHLSMIMNQSAKINGKWYKIGTVIHGYKIVNIELTKVLLSYHKNIYSISTDSESKNLNFKN